MAPHLPSSLASAAAQARVAVAAARCPGDVLAVLEARLAPRIDIDEDRLDLSIRLETPRQALAAAESVEPPPVKDFLRRWAAGAFPFAPAVWIECDLVGGAEESAAPVSIVCAQVAPNADPEVVVSSLLPALQGAPQKPALARRLRECWSALPPSARLLYAFGLHSRPGGAVRLEIVGLAWREMLAYLDRVAGAAAAGRIGEQAAALAGGADGVSAPRLHLSLDLGAVAPGDEAAISPRIGVERSFPRQPAREPRWAELLDRLVDAGLGAAARRDAALAWPGRDSPWTAAGRWPPAQPEGTCVRALSHVKLVCEPDRPPEAKVYLLFGRLLRR